MRPPRVRRGRAPSTGARLFAVLGVVAATLAWTGSPAGAAGSCTAGEPCLLVKVVGNRGQAPLLVTEFSADDVRAASGFAAPPATIVRRSASGQETQVNARMALPLSDLIRDVGIPDGGIHYAEVFDPNGTAHTLETRQLLPAASGNTFANGLSPSVWPDDDPQSPSMNYFRPLEAGSGADGTDPNDANAGDVFSTANVSGPQQPLLIVLHKTGGLLKNIKITGPTTARGATPVQYGVTVPHAPAGLQYQWKVGTTLINAQPSATSTLTHTWPDVTRPTLSALTVDVTAADNSSGSATILVTTCSKKGHTQDCKVKQGGTTTTGGGGDDNPPTTPPTPHPSQTTPTGGPGTTQEPQSPSTPSPTSQPSPSDGSQPTPGTGRTQAPNGDASSHAGKQKHEGPLGGQRVSGQLLTASAAFVVPEQKPTVAASAADSEPSKAHSSWQWTWAAILVLPLLLGLGMAGESLPLRRRLARMKA